MKHPLGWWVALGLMAGAAHAAKPPPKAPPPELPAETLTTTSLAQVGPERVYVGDVAISHIVDGRVRVFNARDGKLLGMVNTGFVGNFVLSAKADELYVATTYMPRGGRGERNDVLEVWDTTQLGVKYEVLLPPHRAQALNYRGLVRPTANGRFLLIQNATPATSITVVDLAQRKVVGEIATPGCWGVWPAASHPARFAMLCGDGKVAAITLDEAGQVAERTASDKLFDADQDPWFHHAELVGDRMFTLSFKGQLNELDLSGATPKLLRTQGLVKAADAKAGWRPGGYQVFTVSPDGRQAVVAMHDKGGEGTHKSPAKALWVVDTATAQRTASLPGHATVSMTFSRNGQRLQALDGMTGALNVWAWDAAKPQLKLLTKVAKAGETSTQLESHD